MSRRESRSSIGARQNDALFEFENFKKKFLLANKHITKLNSTLSVRIEELNAQISLLNVENLRLRASEIALAAQLKRERDKSEKILADAEAASQSLLKHLSYLRDSYDIKPNPATPQAPPSPRARRPEPIVDPESGSPLFCRIARPPGVPGIYEEEEPSSDEQRHEATPPKKVKAKPRLSASKLPLPTRSSSPTRAATPMISGHLPTEHISAGLHSKPRKTLRRPSGLLEIDTEALSVPRSASPAFGSPIRLEAGRAEEAEEYAAMRGEIEVVVLDQNQAAETPKKRKSKTKEPRESGSEKDGAGDVRPREKKKHRDEVEPSDILKLKSKDSSITRTALQPIDSNVHDPTEVEPTKSPSRQFLRAGSPVGSAPTSRGSSSPAPPDDGTGINGNRERRTRKSVNYAEPKLNTKMRKPDPPPGTEPPVRKKRASAAAVMTSTSTLYRPTVSSSSTNVFDNDADSEPRSSLDAPSPPPNQPLPLRGSNGYINPENFPMPVMRPGSAAAMYSPGPSTRTTGSTTSGTSVSSTSSLSGATLKKKKSRPLLSDEDSDGADADAEYMGSGGGPSAIGSWVNVEGRRKALPKRSAAAAAVAAIEDIRRHSMVI